MKFAIRTWGLKLVALSVLSVATSGISAQADEVLPPPGDAGAGGPPPVAAGDPASPIGAALDAVGVVAAAPVGGPALAGPVDGVPVDAIDGPAAGGTVGGGPIDGPPPGPALVHHFVNILRIPVYGGVRDLRSELMLYADNTFQMLLPNDGWGGGWRGGYCRGGVCAPAAPAGPITLLGTWCLNGDELQLTYNEGWMDFGLMTIAPTGPRLRFQGRRWADILPIVP